VRSVNRVRCALSLISIWLTFSAPSLCGQESPPASLLSVTFTPSVNIPAWPGIDLFLPGAGGGIFAEYSFADLPELSLTGGLSYGYAPLVPGLGSMSEMSLMLGAAWRFPLFNRLSARVFALGGLGYEILHEETSIQGWSFAGEGGVGLSYAVSRDMSVRLDSSYFYFFGANGGIRISAGFSMATPLIAGPTPGSLEITELSLYPVFPALAESYGARPLGKVVIHNKGSGTLSEIRGAFSVSRLMEGSVELDGIASLGPGESRELSLTAPVSNALRDVKEPGKTACEVRVSYVEDGAPRALTGTAEADIEAVNAIRWDDDRAAAAFILPEDRAMLEYTSRISAITRETAASGVDRRIRAAVAVRSALKAAGMRHVPDPRLPYERAHDEPKPICSLKLPAATLNDGTGDLPDLAVLYASLLEAVGVESALVLVPKDIFVAINVDGLSLDPNGVITESGRSWLPIEVSALEGSFLDAWQEATAQWRNASAGGSAALIPVREAWKLYPPISPPTDEPMPRLVSYYEASTGAADELSKLKGNAALAAAQAAPEPAMEPRRLLLVLQAQGDSYSDADRVALSNSLALAFGEASPNLSVVVFGGGRFPEPLTERIAAAEQLGADAFLLVQASGERDAPSVSLSLYDIPGQNAFDWSLPSGAGLDTSDLSYVDWSGVVFLVLGGLQGRSGAEEPAARRESAAVTIRALPGARVTGLPEGPLDVNDDGILSAQVPVPGLYTVRVTHPGYYPAQERYYVVADREISLTQSPDCSWNMDLTLFDAFFPGMAAGWYFIPEYAFVRTGMTAFFFGLRLSDREVLYTIPLVNLFLDTGLYFSPEDSPVRFYAGVGGFLRLSFAEGVIPVLDALSPGGAQVSLGAEFPISRGSRLFLEWTPQALFSAVPALLHTVGANDNGPKPRIFTDWGEIDFINLRFGLRWNL
jgi:hypothetical protein